MFNGIKWLQFLEWIILSLVGYYILIAVLYFKKEMNVVIQGKADNTAWKKTRVMYNHPKTR